MRLLQSMIFICTAFLTGPFAVATDTVDVPSSKLVRIIDDFNNDGLSDIAIADFEFRGNMGVDWSIYLQQKPGMYCRVGDVFFHECAFAIRPIKPGVAKLIVSMRKAGIIEYSVSMNGIKKECTNAISSKRYHSLFGHLLLKPAEEQFDPNEYDFHGRILTKK